MGRKAGQKDTGIMSEEMKKLISQIPTAEGFLKEVEAKKAQKPVLGLDDNYDICGNPYNTEPEKAEETAETSDSCSDEKTVGEDVSDYSDDIFESSLNEWYTALVVIENHMDRLFAELRCITEAVSIFSSKLQKSGVDEDELERQVGIVSAFTRTLSNRVNIMCENGIRDMNSQLDVIKIRRCC